MHKIETIFLGLVQGMTEFLPISSSGHLVIFKNFLGIKEPELLLDCSLHLGTLLAVCLFFRDDLKNMIRDICSMDFKTPYASLAGWVLVGTLPTASIGFFFEDFFEQRFGSISGVGVMLLVTGIMLIIPRIVMLGKKATSAAHGGRIRVGLLAALAVGAAQGLAIMPGISRSGTTIVVGLLCGLERDLAGRFSFLLAIPAIVGAVVLQFNAEALTKIGVVPLMLGFVTSALVGYFALRILMPMVRKGHLHYFAPYCWAVGFMVLILSW